MITGQVGLIPSDGAPKSKIVAWASRSYWCHVVVAISETECVSAEPGGARTRPISFYPEIAWSRYPMWPSQRRRIVKYAKDRIGTPYAWGDYWAVGLALITRRAAPEWLRASVAGTNKLLCSQLADLALQAGGIHVFHDFRPAGAVIPGSFGKVFKARGWSDRD